MEFDRSDDVPCSSIAVESIIRTGTAGSLWGLCSGPFEAKQIGLTGSARASFVAKAVGRYGFQCGLFSGIFSITRCGLDRYRSKKDLLNTFIAAGVAGVAAGIGNQNRVWQTAGLICVACAIGMGSEEH